MVWYSKYLKVFEKPFNSVSQNIIDEVRNNLQLLQNTDPVASVVIIAHNEQTRLLSCLWSLSDTRCNYNIEIIGVDNNSSDGTADVYQAVGLRYYSESRKSPGFARNRGIMEAKGKYIICIDADTIYPPKYVETMISAFKKPGVVAVSSLWSYVPSKDFPRFLMFFYELLRDIHLFFLSFNSPERCIRGLVFAHVTDLGKKIGYRVQIRRGEDGALAYALKDYGKIAFIRKRKARPVTSTATIGADGSLSRAFMLRAKSALKGGRKYFFRTKGELKDQESNIINNK